MNEHDDSADQVDIFDHWLDTGTTKRATVKLYADQAVMDEMRALIEEREALEAHPAAAQRAVGEKDLFADIEKREAELYARYEASKMEFTVRPLLPAETKDIREEYPEPTPPKTLPPRAPDSAKAKFEHDLAEWRKAAEAAAVEQDLAMIAKATVSVSTAAGTRDGITVEQVRAMRAREYGPDRCAMLLRAIKEVTHTSGEMPRPKSPTGSGASQE